MNQDTRLVRALGKIKFVEESEVVRLFLFIKGIVVLDETYKDLDVIINVAIKDLGIATL